MRPPRQSSWKTKADSPDTRPTVRPPPPAHHALVTRGQQGSFLPCGRTGTPQSGSPGGLQQAQGPRCALQGPGDPGPQDKGPSPWSSHWALWPLALCGPPVEALPDLQAGLPRMPSPATASPRPGCPHCPALASPGPPAAPLTSPSACGACEPRQS